MKTIWGALLLVFFALHSASASAFQLSLVAGGNLSQPVVNIEQSYGPLWAPAIGILTEFSLGTFTSLEIGAIYLKRKSAYDTIAPGSAIRTEVELTMIEVPVLMRFSLLNIISVGGGLYYGKYQGDKERKTILKDGTLNQNLSYSAASQTTYDFGLVGSVRLNVPTGPLTSIFLDGRYTYDLHNNSTKREDSLKYNDLQALFGFGFGF